MGESTVCLHVCDDAGMSYNREELREIFRKTDGHCHLTGKKLILKHYGKCDDHGAWEVDHSRARARGGGDHWNNLYPASPAANRSKGQVGARAFRARHRLRRAPLSRKQKRAARKHGIAKGVLLGAVAGLRFGPLGVLAGGMIGGLIASEFVPEK
jgi:hypothetical protein